LGENALFERDDGDFHSMSIQIVLMAPQLRQVTAARQSPEVTVEDQQQPVAGEVLQAVGSAFDATQAE